MATKTTTQAGDISVAATWGGTLPGSGDDAVLAHNCTLGDGLEFSARSLTLTGFTLTCTGAPTITAPITGLEGLVNSACTGLTITGNVATSAGHGWTCSGTTTIAGNLTAGGATTVGDGLTLTGNKHLTVSGTVTAVGGSTTDVNAYHGLVSQGTLVAGSVVATGGDSSNVAGIGGRGALINSGGHIVAGSIVVKGGAGIAGGEGISIISADASITGALSISGGACSDLVNYPAGVAPGIGLGQGTINLVGPLTIADDDALIHVDSGTIQTIAPASAANVLAGVPAYTPNGPNGTVVLPSADSVRTGTTFGPGGGLTGTMAASGGGINGSALLGMA